MLTWDPRSFLLAGTEMAPPVSSGPDASTSQYALILLNQPIVQHQRRLFSRLWRNATLRVCADGGANRLRKAFHSHSSSSSPSSSSTDSVPLPHVIVGDLDSLTPSTRSFYSSRGVEISERPSQYATDLQKAIQYVEDWEHEEWEARRSELQAQGGQEGKPEGPTSLTLVIFGGLSGRLDQTVHTLHVLWQLAPGCDSHGGYEDPDEVEAVGTGNGNEQGQRPRGGRPEKRQHSYVVGDGSLVWLLAEGSHKLVLPVIGPAAPETSAPGKRKRSLTAPLLGKACGVLPLGVEGGAQSKGAARVSTKGLQWDLSAEDPQSIGGFLSTSNYLLPPREDGEEGVSMVELTTDKPIYWSVEIAEEEEVEEGDDGEGEGK
ncbi:thiamine pyrophosphokinase [Jaminaea rosea]|uniref:Thiamine pyrophosphokinase n=1 Tax=Jaminaea rosea TaxID=1569628 RepID=A0A316URL0_9BASI|nr:thiamine pyrophosphokinase [Jaminaea rosea]PWN27926.1 thiamine pyrophosphokinase [Jaminaea rosea]